MLFYPMEWAELSMFSTRELGREGGAPHAFSQEVLCISCLLPLLFWPFLVFCGAFFQNLKGRI